MATTGVSTSDLRIRALEAGYGDQRVLHGVSMTLPAAKVGVLVGPGRSGKTTLVRALDPRGSCDGFWRRGDVELPGTCCRIQWQVPTGQEPSLAHVLAPAGTRDEDVERAARQVLDSVWLDSVWQPTCEIYDRLASTLEDPSARLSPSSFRLASFTQAIDHSAEFYVFDEPDADLPDTVTRTITQRILELKRRATVLLVTHNLELARQVADHAVLMVDGRIVEQGASRDFFERPARSRTREFLKWGS